jgi:hypothetical protein
MRHIWMFAFAAIALPAVRLQAQPGAPVDGPAGYESIAFF